MDRMIYTALTAMKGALTAQSATAHNLANASTPGFKADKVAYEPQHLVGIGHDVRAPSSMEVKAADMDGGPRIATGRALDVALDGEAMLAVQARGGDEAYTRRGDLTLSASGLLENGDGVLVLGAGGPISVPPGASLSIAPDGAVMAVLPGGDPAVPTAIDRLKLVSTAGSAVVKGLDGLFRVSGGGVLPDDPTATLVSGSIEGSNVSTTETLIQMIENARSFDIRAKLLTAAKDMDEGGARLMRVSG